MPELTVRRDVESAREKAAASPITGNAYGGGADGNLEAPLYQA
jgi:hypothetical protein